MLLHPPAGRYTQKPQRGVNLIRRSGKKVEAYRRMFEQSLAPHSET